MPLGRLWNFVKRHRRKFFFTGALIGGSYLAFQYLKKKIQELQEKEAADCIEHARRQHHFDSNQRTCNMTVLSMLPSLRESLRRCANTEKVKFQLKTDDSHKLEHWEQLKLLAFSRSITAVYSSCILVVLLRVQLNIIGGYIYLDNLQKLETLPETSIEKKDFLTSRIQERYLSLIQYFITTGIEELSQAVEPIIQSTLGSVSLKAQLRLSDVEGYIEGVRVKMECGVTQGSSYIPTTPLTHFMLPPEQIHNFGEERSEIMYQELLNQTRDMIESEDFHSVLQTCVNKGFTRLLDYLAEGYSSSHASVGETDSNFYRLHDTRIAVAKLVPIVNGVMERLCGDSPNPFIQDLLVMESLRDLAANVYEAFSQQEVGTEKEGLRR